MFHKIREVAPIGEFKLSVEFAEGVTKEYDVAPLFGRIPAFRALERDVQRFCDVRVDVGGHGIVWDDDLDLSCEELWEGGIAVPTPFDGLMALSDATRLWGLSESALRKAISYGKLRRGRDVSKFGKQWLVSAAAALVPEACLALSRVRTFGKCVHQPSTGLHGPAAGAPRPRES